MAQIFKSPESYPAVDFVATGAISSLSDSTSFDFGSSSLVAGKTALFPYAGTHVGRYSWSGTAWQLVVTTWIIGYTVKAIYSSGSPVWQVTSTAPTFAAENQSYIAITGSNMRNSPGGLRLPMGELCLRVQGPSLTLRIDWDTIDATPQTDIAYTVDGGEWVYLTSAGGDTQTIDVGAGDHAVVIRDSSAAALFFPIPANNGTAGLRFSRVVAVGPASSVEMSTPRSPRRRIVVVGDSITQGIGSTHPNTDGWAQWLQAQHPQEIAVAQCGGGYMGLYWQQQLDSTLAATAHYIADCCDGTQNDIVLSIGVNDYTNSTYSTPELWAIALLALIKQIHAAVPQAHIYYQSPIKIGTEGTLPAWRAAALAATAVLSPQWFTFIRGDTQIAVNPANGLHPNTAEYVTYGKCWESILGLWSLVDMAVGMGRSDSAGYLAAPRNVDGPDVSRWVDSCGNGLDSTTDVRSRRPRLKHDASLAGRDHVHSTVADACNLATPTWSWYVDAGHQWHRLILCRFGAGTNYQRCIDGYAANNNYIGHDANDVVAIYAGTSQEVISSPTGTSWMLIDQWQQQSIERTKINGTYASQANCGDVNPAGISMFSSAGAANPAAFDIAEMIVVPVPTNVDFSAAMYTRLALHLTALGITHSYT